MMAPSRGHKCDPTKKKTLNSDHQKRTHGTVAMTKGAMWRLTVLTLALVSTRTLAFNAFFYDTFVRFWPLDKTCQPTQVTIQFTLNQNIDFNDYVYIYLPGVTSGACDGREGANIVPGPLKFYPPWDWYGWFVEGSAEKDWHDSRLVLQAKYTIQYDTLQTIVIDSETGLKQAAPNYNDTWWRIEYHYQCTTGYYALPSICVPNATDPIEKWDNFTGYGYIARDSLSFFPAVLHRKLEITFKFTPGFNLYQDDLVTVNMAGFTNRNATGGSVRGVDVAIGSLYINNGSAFEAGWTEGQFESGSRSGFSNSTLLLRVKPGYTVYAASDQTITVYNKNGIKAHCGVARDSNNITVAVNGTYIDMPRRKVTSVAPIGNGCRAQGYCNGHGTCDLCTSMCLCAEGYGAASDVVEGGIASDCSERVCPSGWGVAGVPQGGYEARQLRECSGAGVCSRQDGTCSCFPGFEAHNCGRMSCPSSSGKGECSGHGRCLTMEILASRDDLSPLSDFTAKYGYSTNRTDERQIAWDSGIIQGCLCESSWEVGLGPGEIQASEYFGPDCSQRRCPTGDDPETPDFDELNCTDRWAPGLKGYGMVGNICYTPCSNRGLCDHSTGMCSCFPGFWGLNCGKRDVLAKGQAFSVKAALVTAS